MSTLKTLAARTLDWVVKKSGRRVLAVARDVIPLPMKRRLSRLLTNEIIVDEDIIESKDGHRFIALQEALFIPVRYEGVYERDLSAVARSLINTGDTVVDIGANFGWYSVLMASGVGEQGQVFSYEPNDEIFPVLERNIELNSYGSRIKLTKCGIGETDERAVLSADNAESAIGYFDKNRSIEDVEGNDNAIEIHPLDDLLADHIGEISFIKIDVEGFEPFVLRGARKIFNSDNPPAVLMEFNLEALGRQDADVASFIHELEALGSTIAKASHGALIELKHIPRENNNLFFLPQRGKFKRGIESIKI